MRRYFSEYFRPNDEDKSAIWRQAIFIFDTNVLLNLYRQSRKASSQMIEIMKALKGRVFLPHQVGVEFHRHREDEIAKQVNAFENVRKSLKSIPARFQEEHSRHPCIPIGDIVGAISDCVEKQIAKVTESQKANQLNFFANDDPILPILDDVFAECCEAPCDQATDDALKKKVEERVQSNVAPCCVSTGKIATPAANNPHMGDGRVWFQIVKLAEGAKKPIVFVTGDQKQNWWRTVKIGSKEQPVGPHFQLIRDVESVSENRFLMYTQEQFLSEAPKYLGVAEPTEAIKEVKQIEEGSQTEKDVGDSNQEMNDPQDKDADEKDQGSQAYGVGFFTPTKFNKATFASLDQAKVHDEPETGRAPSDPKANPLEDPKGNDAHEKTEDK